MLLYAKRNFCFYRISLNDITILINGHHVELFHNIRFYLMPVYTGTVSSINNDNNVRPYTNAIHV